MQFCKFLTINKMRENDCRKCQTLAAIPPELRFSHRMVAPSLNPASLKGSKLASKSSRKFV